MSRRTVRRSWRGPVAWRPATAEELATAMREKARQKAELAARFATVGKAG